MSATRVEFSPEGALAALANGCDLTLLGLTEERQWQEKGRQQFDGEVINVDFSPCSRSLRVDFQQGEGCVVSFWQIVPQELHSHPPCGEGDGWENPGAGLRQLENLG